MRFLSPAQADLLTKALHEDTYLFNSNSNTAAALYTRGFVEFTHLSSDPFTIIRVTALGQLMLSPSVCDLSTRDYRDIQMTIKLAKAKERFNDHSHEHA